MNTKHPQTNSSPESITIPTSTGLLNGLAQRAINRFAACQSFITLFVAVLASLITVSVSAQTNPQRSFLTNGLVAYYAFNGNANDESGNGRHGTLVAGAQIVQNRFGQSHSAVHLNGIDGFISLRTNSLTLKTNSFLDVSGTNARTFSLWVKLDAFRTPAYGGNPILQYGLTGYPQSSFGGATFSMHFDNYDPSKVQVAFWAHTIGLKFNEATTHYMHHVLTYDGKRIVYYLDGRLLGETYAGLNTVDDKITLGGGPDSENPNNRFLGNIDDVRIYTRALSDAEVKALYDYEAAPPAERVNILVVQSATFFPNPVWTSVATNTVPSVGAEQFYRMRASIVEVTVNLKNPIWTPVATNNLPSEPQKFYRLVAQ